MKGRIFRAKYVWKDDPETEQEGYFAVGCEELPELFDNHVTFYLDSEDEVELAQRQFYNDFRITRILT